MKPIELLEAIYSQQTEILALLRAKFSRSERPKALPKTFIPLQEQLRPLQSTLPPSEIEKFINYWTETNSKGIELWQTKPTWNIEKRVARWMMNVREREFKESQRFILKSVDEQPKRERTERVDNGFSKLL